jgi:hypothetical protein
VRGLRYTRATRRSTRYRFPRRKEASALGAPDASLDDQQERTVAVLDLDETGTYVGVGSAVRGDVREKSWERSEQAAGRW